MLDGLGDYRRRKRISCPANGQVLMRFSAVITLEISSPNTNGFYVYDDSVIGDDMATVIFIALSVWL